MSYHCAASAPPLHHHCRLVQLQCRTSGCQSSTSGAPVEYQWSTSRVPVERQWTTSGIPVGYQWLPSEYSWSTSGVPVENQSSPVPLQDQPSTSLVPVLYQRGASLLLVSLQCSISARVVRVQYQCSTCGRATNAVPLQQQRIRKGVARRLGWIRSSQGTGVDQTRCRRRCLMRRKRMLCSEVVPAPV